MTLFDKRFLTVSAIALLGAGSASADLTAADIWASWQATASEAGQSLSAGSEESSGGTLTLRDVTITMDAPEASMNGTIPEVVMTELGNGTVAITMSPEFPIDLDFDPAEGEAGSMSMLVKSSEMTTVASGTPDSISYDFTAPELAVEMNQMMVEDEAMDFDIALVLSEMAGKYTVAGDGPRQIDSNFTATSLTGTAKGSDPEGEEGRFEMTFAMADLASSSTGTMSSLAGMTNLPAMLDAGLESSGTLSHGAVTYRIDGEGPDGTFTMDGKADAGELDFKLDKDGMNYGGTNTGVAFAVSGSEIPFPELAFAVAEYGGRIIMPMTISDEAKNVGVAIRLLDLTMSDAIWSMFDPAAVLPRDPATLVIDVAGKARWLIDVFDPIYAENPPEEVPGEVETVTVNELKLSLAGAELTGAGDFAFDNSAGMPQPAGTLNLRLVGGNGLLDKLVQMGLVPEDQAMGARMMLGLFARPGDGEDTLVSEITVQPDGAILANGQRIK